MRGHVSRKESGGELSVQRIDAVWRAVIRNSGTRTELANNFDFTK